MHLVIEVMILTDILLCDECAWTNEFPGGGSHFWWHAMLPFDWRNLDGSKSNETDEKPSEQPPTESDSRPTDSPVGDGSTVDSISARQNSSLLPIDTSSPRAETLHMTGNPELMESMKDLKGKVLSLDEKITLMAESNSEVHDGIKQRMDAMEAKMTGVEDKLDAMVTELRRVMDTLLATRS